MKHEWKKHEKDLYGVKTEVRRIEVPAQNFLMIDGAGDPNDEDFANRVSALYALSYAIKMQYKKTHPTDEIQDYAVYPLEGIWKQKQEEELIKKNLQYTIMIRQPEVIDADMVQAALAQVKVKKPNPMYEGIRFEACPAHTCVELLHIGSYDEEPASFQRMDDFLQAEGLKRNLEYHREIYLSNALRTAKDKLKTILRYTIE